MVAILVELEDLQTMLDWADLIGSDAYGEETDKAKEDKERIINILEPQIRAIIKDAQNFR